MQQALVIQRDRHVVRAEPVLPRVVRPWEYRYRCPGCSLQFIDDAKDVGVVHRDGLMVEFICPDCGAELVVRYDYTAVEL